MLKTTIDRLKLISFLEGLSFLVLLCVAVPVKYILHEPMAVKIAGPIHGAIFLMFIVVAINAVSQYNWSPKMTFILFITSIIPFGWIYADKKIISPELARRKQSGQGGESVNTQRTNPAFYIWLKRIGIGGFLFFLIKGLIWIGVFAGLIKTCD